MLAHLVGRITGERMPEQPAAVLGNAKAQGSILLGMSGARHSSSSAALVDIAAQALGDFA
jgi:hypothetical protein